MDILIVSADAQQSSPDLLSCEDVLVLDLDLQPEDHAANGKPLDYSFTLTVALPPDRDRGRKLFAKSSEAELLIARKL